ncbi:hypothetical protein KC717_05290 [Candidatus Dojkabacteria bacterium]|uniref:Uncharacterized protein n=1 Tax=Candidatus Dojkabacteria bacterium TaxID=2099670 RepID=A0A955RKM4_9BACT|nr:hypothetical protein [Candidatus Dojkabacteria bacterium]
MEPRSPGQRSLVVGGVETIIDENNRRILSQKVGENDGTVQVGNPKVAKFEERLIESGDGWPEGEGGKRNSLIPILLLGVGTFCSSIILLSINADRILSSEMGQKALDFVEQIFFD